MNNASALVMLFFIGAYAVYFLARTYQDKKIEKRNNALAYMAIGMILGAVAGLFIGRYFYNLIKIQKEGDEMVIIVQSLFFSVLGGVGALFIYSKLMKRNHNKLIHGIGRKPPRDS